MPTHYSTMPQKAACGAPKAAPLTSVAASVTCPACKSVLGQTQNPTPYTRSN